MDEWQPASVALATPDAAPRRAVVVRHFPSPQLPTRRPRLSLVQSVAEYGCTLNLPGSVITPARFVADPAISRNPRPGCRHRQPSCRPGRSRCGSRSQTGDRRLLQCLPSLDGRRRIPSGLGRVQPERRPPQPRPWIGVGSGDTRPGLLLGSPVGGGPVFPSRRRHRRCGSQQLPQPRYFLVRRRTVLAGPTTGQCPFAVPYGRPGQSRPGPSVRFPQFRNAGSGHWLTPRSLFLPKSDHILTNPSD